MVGDEYHTLTLGIRWLDTRYEVELTHNDPGSGAENPPRRGDASFDQVALERLLSLQYDPVEYGRALADGLFCDPAIVEGFVDGASRANQSNADLRLRLRVDRSARELRKLRWELLRHPRSDVLLSTSEKVVFSRLSSGGEGRIKPRARSELTALIAIAAPTSKSLKTIQLDPVDYEGELRRVRDALASVRTRTLGGPQSPVTLDRLLDELRHGVDIVYLVCHGKISGRGTPALVLQDDAGRAVRVEVRDPTKQEPRTPDLATYIAELREKPRLMVLASCQSAGDGEFVYPKIDVTKGAAEEKLVMHPTMAQASMADLLVEAGVPAVIAMQGRVSMRTVEDMMPTLFLELLRDGRIDRALAVARGKVRTHHDWWMPALYSRLKSGSLWSMPAFDGNTGRNSEIIDFAEERGRHEHFFGRADILREIDDWVEKHDSGWLLLTGGPGLGKSALMDRWARGREEAGLPIAAHFIRRAHKDWADPFKLRAGLAAQIEEHFPEQRDDDANPAYRLEQILQRVSPVLVERDERLVLLVDGLDEAMEPGGTDPIPQIFPLEVPPRVFVVVASRPRFPNLGWFKRRTGWSSRLDLDARSESNIQAVREYWGALGPGLGLSEELVRAAIDRAEGNLLHAVQLRKRWSEPGVEPSVDDVPQGFQGMLEELWRRTGTLPKSTKTLVRQGLSLICAARESLTLYAVEELLDWGEGEAEDEFLPHAREILLEERWHEDPRYRPFHEGFRELVERKARREMAKRREKLAEYAVWPVEADDFRRMYALRHRVEHLVESGDADEAARTCLDVGYLTAKACVEGCVAVERDILRTTEVQPSGEARVRLTMLGQLLLRSSHWAVKVPKALPVLLHDRARTHAPELLGDLVGLAHLSSEHPVLRHALQPRPMVRVLEGHQDSVNAVAALPDGRVISGSSDKTLCVWDVDFGRLLATLRGHQDPVTAVAVLSDSSVISGSSDHTLRVWDINSGHTLATLQGHLDSVCAVAVLPDGRVISGSCDNTLRVWDIESGHTLATLRGHQGWVTSIAVLLDGRVVSGSDDETLRVWDVNSGRTLALLEGHVMNVGAVAVLSEGRVISGSDGGALWIWDVDTGRFIAELEDHRGAANAVAVAPDRYIISASYDRMLRVWNLDTREFVTLLQGHQLSVNAIAALPDGRIVSGSSDNTLRLWNLYSDRSRANAQGHQLSVEAVAVLPDGRVVSGSSDGTLRVWDVDTGCSIMTLRGHDSIVNAIAVLPDGRVISASRDQTLRVWDLDSGRTLATLQGHAGDVNVLGVLSDDRVISGAGGFLGEDYTLRVWDIDTGRTLTILQDHQSDVTALAILPDDRVVSAGGGLLGRDVTLRVWDVDAGRVISTLEGHRNSVYALAALHDGRIVSGSSDKTLRIWDIDSGDNIATFEGHRGGIWAAAALPNGRVISGSHDKMLRVWDVDASRVVATVYGEGAFHSIAAVNNNLVVAGDALGDVWFIDLPDLD